MSLDVLQLNHANALLGHHLDKESLLRQQETGLELLDAEPDNVKPLFLRQALLTRSVHDT